MSFPVNLVITKTVLFYGANIIDGFRESGYMTVGTGSVDWFDPSTDTGAVLVPF